MTEQTRDSRALELLGRHGAPFSAMTLRERGIVITRTQDHGLHVATIYARRAEDAGSIDEIVNWKPDTAATTPYVQALQDVNAWQKDIADKGRIELVELVEEARDLDPDNCLFEWIAAGREHDEALRPAYISAERIICSALIEAARARAA